ncbi:MAG: penicillin acylase family protein [Chloroflexota bacterium]
MGKLWRIIGGIVALCLVLGALLAAIGYHYASRGYPRYDGNVAVPGLASPVQIYRDRWGVPYVDAASAADLFFAQGYLHAQDRLWQMEYQRRTGHGRLAELMGEPALESDRFFRTIGLSHAAAREWQSLDQSCRDALQAYAAGVNAFIESHRSRLPVEFRLLDHQPEPWQPLDSLVWGATLAWSQSIDWRAELLRARLIATLGEARAAELLPTEPDHTPLTLPPNISDYRALTRLSLPATPDETSWGGNSWGVAGRLTTSGHPLLASAPHTPLGLPSLWYEVSLHGGGYDVAGFSLPGMPGVILGHNTHIAWGLTNAAIDTQDLYLERLDPAEPRQYAYRGEWLNLEIHQKEIAVKGLGLTQLDEV